MRPTVCKCLFSLNHTWNHHAVQCDGHIINTWVEQITEVLAKLKAFNHIFWTHFSLLKATMRSLSQLSLDKRQENGETRSLLTFNGKGKSSHHQTLKCIHFHPGGLVLGIKSQHFFGTDVNMSIEQHIENWQVLKAGVKSLVTYLFIDQMVPDLNQDNI